MAGALSERFCLVAPDLRGHGASDKPADKAAYQDVKLWAEDVKAVLDGLELRRPVLVAWSYGGILALDYLEHFGSEDVAGLVLVGALVRNGVRTAFEDLGPGASHLQGMMRAEFEVQYPASQSFVGAMTHAPLDAVEMERLLALTMMTPPYVRHALAARKVERDETLRGLELPVLIVQGTEDHIVRAAAGQRLAELAPHARLELWEHVGHAPFLEVPERFNEVLESFVTALL